MQIHLKPEISIQELSDKETILTLPHKSLQLKNFPLNFRNFFHHINQKKESTPSAELFYFLEILKKESLLSYSVYDQDRLFLRLIPNYNTYLDINKYRTIDSTISLQISRFAYLKSEKNTWILQSPLFQGKIIFTHPQSFILFHALSTPKNLQQFIQEFPDISEEATHDFFSLLYQTHLLSNADQNPSLMYWEFHDLLFHAQSRLRTDQSYGGTFRFLNQVPPLPPLKETPSHLIQLYKPDLEILMKSDPTFTQIMETRKSIREHGTKPITKEQLGEFFYRVARVKDTQKTKYYDVTKRPYPGGGACYELELYPLIHSCEGLESGLYRYHPDLHALCSCPISLEKQEQLLKAATRATGKIDSYPQIFILIAARFGRMLWKYETMAYSTILKNTGVLMQTMYLTATAMKLAPCAVGAGNSDLFAEAAQTDYYEETTVGEFILGSI